jgi:two-component sensor histidine kinase
MDIYRQKSWWKITLLIVGLIIIVFTMFYTNYLSQRLAEKERQYIKFYNLAIKSIGDTSNYNQDMSLELLITENVKNPIILDDGQEGLIGFNWGEKKDNDQKFLLKQMLEIQKSGIKPITPNDGLESLYGNIEQYPKIYYKHSNLYNLITWFPLVQGALIAIFMLFGYMIFSSVRRAEQNRVWVGMSKETAHQLGTPISGIMGWTEYIKTETSPTEEQLSAIHELENDIHKLELIANRFSKIGSTPVLKTKNINEIIDKSVLYLKKRSPKNIRYHFDFKDNEVINANVNDHLFSWVVENILRNALDSMEGVGDISIKTKEIGDKVIIDISDTGKGIPQGQLKTVFKPGFSTKKRGWGLGLSLAKRIIKDYHKGKIFVHKSKVNEGTTFRITLPKA